MKAMKECFHLRVPKAFNNWIAVLDDFRGSGMGT